MIEHRGDLWQHFHEKGHQIGISTNGFVKRNGDAVMGRGCAHEATLLSPRTARTLGTYIKLRGNVPGYIDVPDEKAWGAYRLMILPVKHNWWERADLSLIKASVNFLAAEAQGHPEITFHVPRLGCGNGKLDWNTVVRPMMAPLPENVWVHH
jgi:hypothetical protein